MNGEGLAVLACPFNSCTHVSYPDVRDERHYQGARVDRNRFSVFFRFRSGKHDWDDARMSMQGMMKCRCREENLNDVRIMMDD